MEDDDCKICKLMSGKATKGEVRYAKSKPVVWLCLVCYMAEREMPKGKGTVERILQQCGGCHGDSSPVLFCYDCRQCMCSDCDQGHDRHHYTVS